MAAAFLFNVCPPRRHSGLEAAPASPTAPASFWEVNAHSAPEPQRQPRLMGRDGDRDAATQQGQDGGTTSAELATLGSGPARRASGAGDTLLVTAFSVPAHWPHRPVRHPHLSSQQPLFTNPAIPPNPPKARGPGQTRRLSSIIPIRTQTLETPRLRKASVAPAPSSSQHF